MKTHASPPPAFGLPELALIAITFIWGGTFLVVQHAVTVSGPLAFVAARFAVAAGIGALICRGKLRHLTKAELLTGM
ncbi:MAG: EamA family transporter, partial [Janthinobacterium sp.]